MNILTLSIKQKFFDEILSGKKTQEFREIRPTNSSKYMLYELNGKKYADADQIPDEEGDLNVEPIKYDAIKFLTGAYTGKRPYALVEVKDANIEFFCDEEGNDITYEYNGETYVAAQMVYDLGRVIEKSEY